MGSLAALLGVALHSAGELEPFELKTLDMRQRLVPARALDSRVQVVVIDDPTIRHFGWPVPRSVHAQLLQLLKRSGARVVAYDILYADPDPKDPRNDAAFGSVAQTHPCTIFPGILQLGEGEPDPELQNYAKRASLRVPSQMPIHESEAADLPIEILRRANDASAHLHIVPGEDGVFRGVPVAIRVGGDAIPTLGLAAFACAQETPPIFSFEHRGGARWEMNIGMSGAKTRRISMDGRGVVPVLAQASSKSTELVSALDLLIDYKQSLQTGVGLAEVGSRFKDRIVIVGQSAPSFGDHGPSSRGAEEPLVLMHANFLDNLLNGDSLERQGPVGRSLMTLLLALGAMAVVIWGRSWHGTLWGAGVLSFYILFNIACFFLFDFWIELFAPVATGAFSVAVVGIARIRRAELRQEQLRLAFSRFVAPDLVQRLVQIPEEQWLGGEQRTITILFCDVVGYTRLSNTRSPMEVMGFLRDYIETMSHVVLKHGGTIDKIMGDGLMCLFGAPVPTKSFVRDAAIAALGMKRALQGLKNRWIQFGDASPSIRIGIATGEVFVGNVGTARHIEYTAIGAPVNLAARLESSAGSGDILVCRETRARLGELFHCAEMAPLALKGYDGGYRPLSLDGIGRGDYRGVGNGTGVRRNAVRIEKETYHARDDRARIEEQGWDFRSVELIVVFVRQKIDNEPQSRDPCTAPQKAPSPLFFVGARPCFEVGIEKSGLAPIPVEYLCFDFSAGGFESTAQFVGEIFQGSDLDCDPADGFGSQGIKKVEVDDQHFSQLPRIAVHDDFSAHGAGQFGQAGVIGGAIQQLLVLFELQHAVHVTDGGDLEILVLRQLNREQPGDCFQR